MPQPTTEEIATYLKAAFNAEMRGELGLLQMPRYSLDLLEECNFAAKLLVKATRNQSEFKQILISFQYSTMTEIMPWSVVDYVEELDCRSKLCRGRNETLEREMERLFPPPRTELESRPCVVIDCKGRILLWYLPGLLSSRQQVLDTSFS